MSRVPLKRSENEGEVEVNGERMKLPLEIRFRSKWMSKTYRVIGRQRGLRMEALEKVRLRSGTPDT